MSKVLQGFDSLGQVAVELGHAGREEGVDHGAREEASQVGLEEAEHLGFVGLSANKAEQAHIVIETRRKQQKTLIENINRFI